MTPSVTTYMTGLPYPVYFNPTYRVFTVDGFYKNSSFGVLKHETRYFDVKKANEQNYTNWKTEYDTQKDYNLQSLFPKDLSQLVDKMIDDLNSPLSEKFLKYYYKSAFKNSTYCDSQCRLNLVCGLKQARYDKFVPC
jgi:hypothetical protein